MGSRLSTTPSTSGSAATSAAASAAPTAQALAYEGVRLDIVQDRRSVVAYTMSADERATSKSLATTAIEPLGDARLGPAGCPGEALLRYTEHTFYLDGTDGGAARRAGVVADLLDALAAELGIG